jgi:hypothetical protein
MAALTWDDIGERLYETGVDHGVLYVPGDDGVYDGGVAWSGLTTVTEQPSGADASPQYADNIKYLNLIAAEQFGATIEAFTYPPEFEACDGTVAPVDGVVIGQQSRKIFGFCYRTLLGNDVEGTDYGYKLHLVYGAQATPSEKAYGTVNDSPAAIAFSWTISTTPVAVTGHKPTAIITIDSTKVDAGDLATLEAMLYNNGGNPTLPLPDDVIAIFEAGLTAISLSKVANQPTFVATTGVITIPDNADNAHLNWFVNGVAVGALGAQTAIASLSTAVVTATPKSGYYITGDSDWSFTRTT